MIWMSRFTRTIFLWSSIKRNTPSHSQKMNYPPEVTTHVNRAVDEVISWIQEKREHFAGFVERWYERFLALQNK